MSGSELALFKASRWPPLLHCWRARAQSATAPWLLAIASQMTELAVSEVGQTLALPYRGGAVALFSVRKIQRVVGIITIAEDSEDRVPAYGEVTVTAGAREITSPIGGNGAFYFEDLPAGGHSALVRDRDGRECAFTMTVPTTEGEVVPLGTLRCEVHRP